MNVDKKTRATLRRRISIQRVEKDINPVIEHPDAAFNRSDRASTIWKLTYYFNEEQLVLILSILQKKPHGISIKDYLKCLQSSIKPEASRSNLLVDSGEWWKQQCENQYALTQKLQARVRILENHIGILEKRIKNRPMMPQKPSTEGSDEDEIPSHPQSNSPSHGGQSLISRKLRGNYSLDTIPHEENEIGSDITEYGEEHLMIVSYLQQIIEMRLTLCDQANPPVLDLESTPVLCRQLIEFAWKAISDCTLKYADVRKGYVYTKVIKSFIYLVNEMAESYKTCVDIMTDLFRTLDGRGIMTKTSIIFSLCSFFDNGLHQLQKLCNANPKLSATSNKPALQETDIPMDEGGMIGLMANLLVGILRRIDWQSKDELHEQIFEGVLAIILNHVGNLMSVTIFHEEVAASNAPGNISSGESLQTTKNEMKLKSKYLICILDVALKVKEERKMLGGETEALVKKAQKKIQRTFMKSIIGGNISGLRRPEKVAAEVDIPELKALEKYSPEWTIQSIFSMIEVKDTEAYLEMSKQWLEATDDVDAEMSDI